MQGKDKIANLLTIKGQDLIKQLIPPIIDIAEKVGIQNIGQSGMTMPNFCLQPDELKKILTIRNIIVDKLNNGAKTIDSLSKIIEPLNIALNVSSTSLTTLDIAKTAAQIVIPTLPTSSPGAPSAAQAALVGLSTINDLENILKPKIQTSKNIINNINNALDLVNGILLKLINLLNSIDQYLKGCNVVDGLNPLNDYLNVLIQIQQLANDQNQTLNIYKNFILEIVKEPFSPTVDRAKAVAKNNQGIILLQTPLSFTTNPQILIEELKLIIDSNNLKAN